MIFTKYSDSYRGRAAIVKSVNSGLSNKLAAFSDCECDSNSVCKFTPCNVKIKIGIPIGIILVGIVSPIFIQNTVAAKICLFFLILITKLVKSDAVKLDARYVG